MKKYSEEEYREKMKIVYGKGVVNDFEEFEQRNDSHFPKDYREFKTRLRRYVDRIGSEDTGINEEKKSNKVSNYEDNMPLTRFILISIEKHYSRSKIDFTKKDKDKGANKWEMEHIIPRSKIEDYTPDYIRCLGNLTLISRVLNGDEKYKQESYKKKRKIIRDSKWREKRFYINKVFKNQWNFNETLIDLRYKWLKKRFLNIFYEDKSRKTFTLDKFEKIIGIRKR